MAVFNENLLKFEYLVWVCDGSQINKFSGTAVVKASAFGL
jgi:hypothetical protein